MAGQTAEANIDGATDTGSQGSTSTSTPESTDPQLLTNEFRQKKMDEAEKAFSEDKRTYDPRVFESDVYLYTDKDTIANTNKADKFEDGHSFSAKLSDIELADSDTEFENISLENLDGKVEYFDKNKKGNVDDTVKEAHDAVPRGSTDSIEKMLNSLEGDSSFKPMVEKIDAATDVLMRTYAQMRDINDDVFQTALPAVTDGMAKAQHVRGCIDFLGQSATSVKNNNIQFRLTNDLMRAPYKHQIYFEAMGGYMGGDKHKFKEEGDNVGTSKLMEHDDEFIYKLVINEGVVDRGITMDEAHIPFSRIKDYNFNLDCVKYYFDVFDMNEAVYSEGFKAESELINSIPRLEEVLNGEAVGFLPEGGTYDGKYLDAISSYMSENAKPPAEAKSAPAKEEDEQQPEGQQGAAGGAHGGLVGGGVIGGGGVVGGGIAGGGGGIAGGGGALVGGGVPGASGDNESDPVKDALDELLGGQDSDEDDESADKENKVPEGATPIYNDKGEVIGYVPPGEDDEDSDSKDKDPKDTEGEESETSDDEKYSDPEGPDVPSEEGESPDKGEENPKGHGGGGPSTPPLETIKDDAAKAPEGMVPLYNDEGKQIAFVPEGGEGFEDSIPLRDNDGNIIGYMLAPPETMNTGLENLSYDDLLLEMSELPGFHDGVVGIDEGPFTSEQLYGEVARLYERVGDPEVFEFLQQQGDPGFGALAMVWEMTGKEFEGSEWDALRGIPDTLIPTAINYLLFEDVRADLEMTLGESAAASFSEFHSRQGAWGYSTLHMLDTAAGLRGEEWTSQGIQNTYPAGEDSRVIERQSVHAPGTHVAAVLLAKDAYIQDTTQFFKTHGLDIPPYSPVLSSEIGL